jgi:hypothetical protein
MGHPNGGTGNIFPTKHSFAQAYNHVGQNGVHFNSTTGEKIYAKLGFAQDKITRTIVYHGERVIHGRVCKACWGYRGSCTKERIGQCSEALDQSF